MNKNRGFAHALIPVLLLVAGLLIALFLVGKQTGFFNRAGGNPQSSTNPNPWINAARFYGAEGSAGYLEIPTSNLDLSGNFTYETWVKFDFNYNFNQFFEIIAVSAPGNYSSPFHISLPNHCDECYGSRQITAYITLNNTQYLVQSPTQLQGNIWYHLAFVKDTSELRLYLNGKLDTKTSASGSLAPLSQITTIGALISDNQAQNFFLGQMDEILLTRTVRFTSNFSPPSTPYTAGLIKSPVFHYHLDSTLGSGRVTPDENHNHDAFIIGKVNFWPSSVPTTPPSYTAKVYDDQDPALTFSGTWIKSIAPKAFKGAYKYSGTAGNKVSLQVDNAKDFTVGTAKGINRGIYIIKVDGTQVGTFDGYGVTEYGVKVGPFSLTPGSHTISVEVSGQKNPKSSKNYIILDSISVSFSALPPPSPPPGTTVYDDKSPSLIYSGNWIDTAAPKANAGSYKYSGTAGDSVSLNVSGAKSFSLISVIGINRGLFNMFVDEIPVSGASFDGYGNTLYGAKFGPFPLPNPGAHTIKIAVTGQKNPKSTRNYVVIDSIEVQSN